MPHESKHIYMTYAKEKLQQALQACRERRLSATAASKQFGVPRSTLTDRLRGKVDDQAKPGRKPVIPLEVENKICDSVCESAERGMGIGRQDVLHRIGVLAKRHDIPTPFRDGRPGKFFWKGFLTRHPEITLRKPEPLSGVRARAVNHDSINNYFHGVAELFQEYNFSERPNLVWNADETGISFSHTPSRVVARAGCSIPGRVANSRESLTMLPCMNANGVAMPPMFIIKGKTKRSLAGFQSADCPQDSVFTIQKNAWQENTICEEWFEEVFLKHCGNERPQLLIWDSHSSHEALSLLEVARENNIFFLAFPPHTTHILCPLDVGIFSPFKRAYNKYCTQFMSESPENTINKSTICNLITKAYQSTFTRTNIVSSFEATGLFPLNPSAIKPSSFTPSASYPSATSTATDGAEPMEGTGPGESAAAEPVSTAVATAVATAVLVEAADEAVHEIAAAEPVAIAVATAELDEAVHIPDPSEQSMPTRTAAFEVPLEVVFPDGSSTTTSMPVMSWDNSVDDLFSPPTSSTQKLKKTKKITAHRLLTSDEVMNIKRAIAEKKDLELRVKEERKRKREEKREEKLVEPNKTTNSKGKGKGKGKKFKILDNRQNEVCVVCAKPEGDDEDWVQCDACTLWYHQYCVPDSHTSIMNFAIFTQIPFHCQHCYSV